MSGSSSSSSSSRSSTSGPRPSPTHPRPPLARSPSSSLPTTKPHPPPPPTLPLPPPLHLTVRFSASLPDLHLDIPHPATTTVVALKHLIRARLAPPDSTHRLRFIHGGRILPDAAVLPAVLRPVAPPPAAADPRGKGKAPAGAPPPPPRVYVNCSIGDALTPAELAAEAVAAAAAPSETSARSGTAPDTRSGADTGGGAAGGSARTPRGFDRLLATGFSAAEVNALRLQFRSIQAAAHTPDTMPSPSALRRLEDAWLDNHGGASTMAGGGGGGSGEGGAGADDEFGLVSGLLDILIRGMTIGFLWPVGSVGWLVREEGLWSRKWQVFVSFGFVLSLLIGTVKSISGDR